MHEFFEAIFGAYVHLIGWTSRLADILGGLVHRVSQPGDLAFASIVVASLLLCVFACVWALIERGRSAARHYVMSATLARAQSEIRFRESVIQAAPEAIVVMGSDLSAPLSYRGGGALLQACLSGADAPLVAAKMEGLIGSGTPFTLTARTAKNPSVAMQGCVVGSRAAIFLRAQEGPSSVERELRAIVEALPMPVWIRDGALALTWANRAFLAASGSTTLEEAMRTDARLSGADRELAGAVLEGNDVIAERRYAVIAGQRRALSIDMMRVAGSHVAGVATDVTEAAQAEARLGLVRDANADILEHAGCAIAVFDKDRRLAASNKAYARLWGLSESWLDTNPTFADIFDRLRETRRLPEQRDFQAWKRDHQRLFETAKGRLDETWHVAGGASVRVRAYPHLLGGVYYVFEDIGEVLRLNTSLHMLKQTQRATLDVIDNGMAVFGPDGRLKMHNTAFAELWQLDEPDLAAGPHLSNIASACTAKIGRDGVWNMVAAGVTSSEPSRYGEWGRLTRADGRVLSVSLTRLPLGATLVVFEDLTDLERFVAATHADAAA